MESVHPTLQATLWVQNAAEYDALTLQAYQTAERLLPTALADQQWSASLEQLNDDYTQRPPAVVLDIDETVLDNSPFQARMIGANSGYNPIAWEQWVLEARADAVPGALAFTQKAAELGITVFYLSNREANTEQATRDNLQALGFPITDKVDAVLLKGEQPSWTSAKTERRSLLADQYRILMLFGDDLNDFLPAKKKTTSARDALVRLHSEKFGTTWFQVPNPIYGSWTDEQTAPILNPMNE